MIPEPLDSRTKRQKLLAHLPWVVRSVANVEGVRKISILGSITTQKLKPKEIDFLVMVEDSAELEPEYLKTSRRTKRWSRHVGTLQGGVISRGLA